VTLKLALGLGLGISALLAAVIFFLYFRGRKLKRAIRVETPGLWVGAETARPDVMFSKVEMEESGMEQACYERSGVRGEAEEAELPDSKMVMHIELPS
jgi:hypothetical protein